MKKYIRSGTEVVYEKEGFVMEVGRNAFFYESDMKNLTDKIIRQFIKKIAEVRGASSAIRDAALYNEATLKDFRRRIDKAILTRKKLSDGRNFYTVSGKGFSMNFPQEDFLNEVVVF